MTGAGPSSIGQAAAPAARRSENSAARRCSRGWPLVEREQCRMKRPDVSFFDRFGKGASPGSGAKRPCSLDAPSSKGISRVPRACGRRRTGPTRRRASRCFAATGSSTAASRLLLYVQAVSLAPEGHAVRDIARRKRALLALGVAREGTTSAAARLDLLDACKDLEALGESTGAAEGYALVGDVEGEARALVEGRSSGSRSCSTAIVIARGGCASGRTRTRRWSGCSRTGKDAKRSPAQKRSRRRRRRTRRPSSARRRSAGDEPWGRASLWSFAVDLSDWSSVRRSSSGETKGRSSSHRKQ